ncbi:nodulation protein NolB [Mesorhizobium neociceri]|uniref:Nodulation protein NolB n=1 Tax=Mesorhizobium neociceri TaxID=1307853 RepID=A0A838B8W9_9HYPH|nr:nodulation protein NolB [Mesorhizobium neociceri]MBA1142419.1 nodulation protein NolB [Mesorhizobium neociceri]
MMMPVASPSASLTDILPKVASPSLGEQAQFERALTQAAASTKNDTAPGPAGVTAVSPHLDVERATAQTTLRGDRLLQTVSSLYRNNAVTPAGLDHQVGLEKNPPPGRAQNVPGVGETAGTPAAHDFGSMVADLRDLYNGVTQLSLVSKAVSGLTSSVNTLIKQG